MIQKDQAKAASDQGYRKPQVISYPGKRILQAVAAAKSGPSNTTPDGRVGSSH